MRLFGRTGKNTETLRYRRSTVVLRDQLHRSWKNGNWLFDSRDAKAYHLLKFPTRHSLRQGNLRFGNLGWYFYTYPFCRRLVLCREGAPNILRRISQQLWSKELSHSLTMIRHL